MLTLFTFTFAKRRIQCNVAHRVQIRWFRTQTTLAWLAINPFRLSFSEPKCARGGHILFLESIFQHRMYKIVHYNINHKSCDKKSIHFMKAK